MMLTKKDLLVVRRFLEGCAGMEVLADDDEDCFYCLVEALRTSPRGNTTLIENVALDALPARLRRLGGRQRRLPPGSPVWASPKWDWNVSLAGAAIALEVPDAWADPSGGRHAWTTLVDGHTVLYQYISSWTTESLNGWGSVHNEHFTWVEDPIVFGEVVACYLLGPRKRSRDDVEGLAVRLGDFFRAHPALKEYNVAEDVISPND